MRHLVCLTVAVGLTACGRASVEPAAPAAPAVATVQGRVLSAAGSPVASVAVVVTCASGAPVSAATDATGQYGANLTAPATVLSAGEARVSCTFLAGDAAAPRARTAATVGFGQSGLPHAIQTVGLREAP